MQNKHYTFIILFLVLSSCAINKNSIHENNEWTDVIIETQELPIHKIENFKDLIWATDYGNGIMYKSSNNGDSWQKLYEFKSEYIERIQFIDESTGYVCGDYGYVYKTEDGGNTWNDISPAIPNRIIDRYRNDPTKEQKPDGNFVAYYGMQFLNRQEGYISGYKQNPKLGFRESFQKLFFHTTNGGKDWVKIPKSKKESFMESFLKKLQPQNIDIAGTYYFNLSKTATTNKNEEENIIFEMKVYDKQITSILPENGFESIMIRNIVFLDDKNGFLFGGSLDEGKERAIIYETEDGGKTWEFNINEYPHIHESKLIGDYLWITGKEKLVKKKRVKSN